MNNRPGNGKDDDTRSFWLNKLYSAEKETNKRQCKDSMEGWDSRPIHIELQELSE
jgi:hypothetical protein